MTTTAPPRVHVVAPQTVAVAPPAPARAHPQAVLGLIGLGAVAVLALWWQNTPSVHGLGDWLTNGGRITGLLAGYAMVVLLALMARIPPLERGVGADRLARWHAMGGRYSVSLVVVHGLLITWGYAVTAHTDVVHQGWTLLRSYPDVLMATVAGLLLVGVGAVSARAARRRMAYETWYYLHLYTYLAVVLAFSHQFADGAEFVDNRTARVVWSAMYLAVGGAIAWYRVVVPVRTTLRHPMRVVGMQVEGPDVFSVVVRGRDVQRLAAEGGQFFRWRFLTRDLWWASSPYSLSAPPDGDLLRITVKVAGGHSAALAHVRPGTRVLVEGPYGSMGPSGSRRRQVLLVAGGIGVTPLRALMEDLPADRQVTLFYRATTDDDVVLRAELEQLATARGARLLFVIGSRADLGGDPVNAATLTRNVLGLREHEAWVCGPPGMTQAAVAALRAAGVPRRHVHSESFTF